MTVPTTIDSIKRSLVGLKMPRALEVLDAAVRRVEQGEMDGIGALDQILIEELTHRENRRVRTALLVSRLTTIKSLQGFDFTFQPCLDRSRIMALAELKFIDRAEVVHLLGPPESDSYCSSGHHLTEPKYSDADRRTADAADVEHRRHVGLPRSQGRRCG